jgi:alkylhydroperoxidase family enzyme
VSFALQGSRVAILDNAEAWKRLPPVEVGFGQRLPAWARALAGTLPHTTANMLELDFLHRSHDSLDPILRGQIRWVAAHANGCRYSQAYAEADLRRAGADPMEIRKLSGDLAVFPESQRAALLFARKLTQAGYTITDEEVAQLIKRYGERRVVAMVMLVSYASFQDRLFLALDLQVQAGEPLRPLEVHFAERPLGASPIAPPRKELKNAYTAAPLQRDADLEWLKLDYGKVQEELAKQRARQPRIKLVMDKSVGNRWGHLCRSYQPELAAAWAACSRAFAEEASQDPVFEQSIFWIVTRSVQCFY